MHDGIAVNSLVRNQWMGFEGAPKNQNFNVHMPFKLFDAKHGAGITLMNDEAGFENNISVGLNYAFQKELADGKLGVGFGAGFFNQSLSNSDWQTRDDVDLLLPNGDDEPIVFDLSLGAYYKTEKLFFGLSVNHLTAPEVKYKDLENGYPYYQRAAFLTFGYRYQLTNPLFEIEPSMMVYTTGSSTQVMIDGLLYFKSRFWGGLGYRVIDAVSILAGAEVLDGLNVGVAYDIPTSQIVTTSAGSFEFTVQYIFKLDIEKDNRIYKSVRFL
jgi:type IX secretion system PorP/SprF family membrane protein